MRNPDLDLSKCVDFQSNAKSENGFCHGFHALKSFVISYRLRIIY